MKKIKTVSITALLGFALLFTLIQPTSSLLADPEYGELDKTAWYINLKVESIHIKPKVLYIY